MAPFPCHDVHGKGYVCTYLLWPDVKQSYMKARDAGTDVETSGDEPTIALEADTGLLPHRFESPRDA